MEGLEKESWGRKMSEIKKKMLREREGPAEALGGAGGCGMSGASFLGERGGRLSPAPRLKEAEAETGQPNRSRRCGRCSFLPPFFFPQS